MGTYRHTVELPRPLAEVFAFMSRPANWPALAPPDLHLELIEGPEILALGSRLTWKLRRLGLTQTLVGEVTAFAADGLFVETQRQGPFASWEHRRIFGAAPTGTLFTDEIAYERPRGLLGLVLTEAILQADLDHLFQVRDGRLTETFGV